MSRVSRSVLLLIPLTIRFSEEIKWITERRTLYECKGNSVDLIWDFDEDENKISKLEWYFNNKIICTSSDTVNFIVNPLYQGRLEKLDRRYIRLKNISVDDEGIFTLYPLLKWSTSQDMQNISLQVLEPPTNICTCENNIRQPAKLTSKLTASHCGSPQVESVWNRNETFKELGERNNILTNSSIHMNEILCCLEGAAMKCVDDPRQFCKYVRISQGDDKKGSKGGTNTLQTVLMTSQVTNDDKGKPTDLHCTYVFVVCCVLAVIIVCNVFIIYKIAKMNKDLAKDKLNLTACIIGEGRNLKRREAITNVYDVAMVAEHETPIIANICETAVNRNGQRNESTQMEMYPLLAECKPDLQKQAVENIVVSTKTGW